MRTRAGFTLVEVLVALAILAVALAAAVQTGASSSASLGYLRDRTYAHWVAANQLAELQLTESWPAPGRREGKARLGGHEWSWEARITPTPDARVRRADVLVRRAPDDAEPVARLAGFFADAGQQPTPP